MKGKKTMLFFWSLFSSTLIDISVHLDRQIEKGKRKQEKEIFSRSTVQERVGPFSNLLQCSAFSGK
jgi:hypothetical protein